MGLPLVDRLRTRRANQRPWEGFLPPDPDRRLTWPPPALTSPTTVHFNNDLADAGSTYTWTGDDSTDYVLVCDEALGFSIIFVLGQNSNVIANGFEFNITEFDDDGASASVIHLDETGAFFHAEGWKAYGPGVRDMIDIQAGGSDSVVQLQNFYMGEHNVSDLALGHPDCIQSWNGPYRLRVDRLSANCRYQGIYLEPDDTSGGMTIDQKTFPVETDIRNVDIRVLDQPDSTWVSPLLWHHPITNTTIANPTHPQHAAWQAYCDGCYHENLWVEPWPGHAKTWANLTNPQMAMFGYDNAGRWTIWLGRRSTRFVDPDSVGIGYATPGYQDIT